MELLPLAVIGWLYAAGCVLALALGAWLVIGAHLAGEDTRRQLAAHVLDDAALFGIWLMGLAGGVGLLLEKSWSHLLLELFCWVLMVLAAITAYTHWRAAPPPRGKLALSLVLFFVPLAAVCAATILTLRSAIH
ncbi:MAG: hypothetical protein HY017_32720 [Betaproteobacteria bacterium]|nr:hypothetical protein [Betaproteobacteria bacterium]